MGWGPFDLTGKAAIVTGAAMGIGFGCARLLRQAGADVLIADLDADAAVDAEKRLADSDGEGRIATVTVDVGDPSAVDAMVDRCVQEFGSLDVLVNNAGIYPVCPIVDLTPELLRRILRVNVEGVILATRAAAIRMIDQGSGGAVVNIASMDAFHPSFAGLATYGASKGAVVSFTKHAAAELGGHKIRINAIAPGAIATEGGVRAAQAGGASLDDLAQMSAAILSRLPMGRGGEPDDIAKVAVFLASDAADFVTGVTILADGGALLM